MRPADGLLVRGVPDIIALKLTDVGVSVKTLSLLKRTTEGSASLSHSLCGYANNMMILLCATSTSLSLRERYCVPHLSATLR